MKRIILLIAVAVLAVSGYAQNANRSGFFAEASAGATMGNAPLKNYSVYTVDEGNKIVKYREKVYSGGFMPEVGLGYRWATSNNFAVDVKLKYQYLSDNSKIKLMPGIRYTSAELSKSSNVSLYVSANIGAQGGNDPADDVFRVGFAYELSVGFNITSKLYAGLIWSAGLGYKEYNYVGHIDGSFEDVNLNDLDNNYHYGLLGLTIGYRF